MTEGVVGLISVGIKLVSTHIYVVDLIDQLSTANV